MVSRRKFLQFLVLVFPALSTFPFFKKSRAFGKTEVWVNDIHSKLNRTKVLKEFFPTRTQEIKKIIQRSLNNRIPVCVAGGQHSMGGQQFATGGNLINMRRFNRVRHFEKNKGLIEVEAGIQWPELISYSVANQKNSSLQWGIRQKQTGADRLSIGGALSSNVHGRGLKFNPLISDVESFVLIDYRGNEIFCSRRENPELFGLAIGGYGLFGIISKITLRLSPRQKIKRVVDITSVENMMSALEGKISQGYLYGDFQFSTDETSKGFLGEGVFSTYKPVGQNTKIKENQRSLSEENWKDLLFLAHANKAQAFKEYSEFYKSTNGQVYWSDTHQMSIYLDDYHVFLDQKLKSPSTGSEMITEVYVPRKKLLAFLEVLQKDFGTNKVNLIYGTIRFIEKDDESFLPWATDNFACIVMNLHIDQDSASLEKAKVDFQRIIDRAIDFGGSYFLTYHRWARKDQVLTCYPQFPEFLRLKRKYDPNEVFQSDWYRHYSKMFSEDL